MKRTYLIPLLTLTAWLLFGCMPATSPGPGVPKVLNGYFIDGPMAGLAYQTSSGRSGTTDVDGLYTYTEGDTVEFLLGGQVLGSPVAASRTVSPLTLFGAAGLDGSAAGVQATNLIRLLMSLDDGSNPYGLTISAAVETALAAADVDLSDLLASGSFATEALALLEEVTDGEVELPDVADAQGHWELSEQLVEELSAVSDDTLVLAVRIPDGYIGSSLRLTYNAAAPPPGQNSYQSGQYHTITEADNGIVVFRGKLHAEHWQLNLSLLQDDDHVQVGDLLSFFHAGGFSQTLPDAYELDLTEGGRVLQADLSSGDAIQIDEVFEVSGRLVVPTLLPDGAGDWTDGVFRTDFSLFNSLQNGGQGVAMVSVTLELGDQAGWDEVTVGDTDCYSIPFSTTLPSGYAYSLQSYYRTVYPGGYETYSWDSIDLLDADVTDIELVDTTWSVPLS